MSRVQSNRRVAPTKPFCKVCFDAGKKEEEYTSHFVKDRDGKVVCTTLMNQECRYCFQPGHTVKFCQALKKREEEKQHYAKECARVERVRAAEVKVPDKKREEPRYGGGFAALADDSDDDECESQKEDEFPALSGNVTLRPHQQHFEADGASFAARLAAPKPQAKPVSVFMSAQKRDAWSDDEETPVVLFPEVSSKKVTNWADADDDSDADDE